MTRKNVMDRALRETTNPGEAIFIIFSSHARYNKGIQDNFEKIPGYIVP